MKKRSLSILLILALCLGLSSAAFASGDPSGEPSGETGGNVTWSLDTNTGVLTISGTGPMEEDYYPIIDQPAPWYPDRSAIQSVVIEPGVTTIGFYVFSDCENLKSVTIPGTVTGIGPYAFWNCTGLTDVTIPKSVTGVGSYAFDGCTSLTDVFYSGTESDWEAVTVREGNDPLTNAQIHYNWTPPAPFDADGSGVIDAADAAVLLRSEPTHLAAALIIAALTLQETVGIRR